MAESALPRPARLGDLLAIVEIAGKDTVPTPPGFEATIRACAEALGENPDELLRLANGTTPLARLVRFLLGEQRPAPRLSNDQALWLLHHKLRDAGLVGQALWNEIVHQHYPKIDVESARKGVQRYRKHLRELPMPESLPELFAPEFSTDKTVKPRGPKPGRKRGTQTRS